MSVKKIDDVFGISNTVSSDSYVDRGNLDEVFSKYISRDQHLALRGESKCGKSWLRRKNLDDPIVVQCRLNKDIKNIYVDALSQLGINLEIEEKQSGSIKGTVSASTQLGSELLSKIGLDFSVEGKESTEKSTQKVGHDINDLRYIADLIIESDRELIIEDFHYMSTEQRKTFSFELKALFEYGLPVVIIGVWSRDNLLLYLNPDLSGRVHELEIFWSDSDLERVLDSGGEALNLKFSDEFKNKIIKNCYGNVGILQKLTQMSLDKIGIEEKQESETLIDDLEKLESAAMSYAEQLNPLYQQFAERVSSGIRTRENSTGIYAHAMAVIMNSSDEKLKQGISVNDIYQVAHKRESRIQKGNLKSVLSKFEQLQVDDDGRGLILSYDEANEEVTAVDRQLLLYRKYSTVEWPWEDLIEESENA